LVAGIRTIKVTASDVAYITDITIVDLRHKFSNRKCNWSCNYEYSLNDPYGPFQSSNFFDNVPAGIHEVFINDKMDVVLSANVLVLGAPTSLKWRRI
jgi:putative heme degradation protein